MPSPVQPKSANTISTDGIPAVLLATQQRQETMFIAMKSRERAVIALRGQRPRPFVLPPRPGLFFRALLRMIPPLALRWNGRILRQSGLFDADWYLEKYPDVKAAGVDPERHFLKWGAADQRDPSPRFSTSHYLKLYPDVKNAGVNPVIHYLTAGWEEKRSIHPLMPEQQE